MFIYTLSDIMGAIFLALAVVACIISAMTSK